jgi:hypothetical protein
VRAPVRHLERNHESLAEAGGGASTRSEGRLTFSARQETAGMVA